jgi:DNA polymerase
MLEIVQSICKCPGCSLNQENNKLPVCGTGNVNARLMLVGEGPGEQEDRIGYPFVGKSGALLTKMLSAIGLCREEVYIVNVVKCRPPDNRTPNPDEIEACLPFLVSQICTIEPEIICALGATAAKTIIDPDSSLGAMRQKIHKSILDVPRSIKVICTYHPAYLLRNPPAKKKAWKDLKALKYLLDKGE